MGIWSRGLGIVSCCLAFHAIAACQCPDGKNVENLNCKQLSEGIVQWTINKPAVDKYLTEYPAITFEKGQIVVVSAGGCINVSKGEQKQVWKDYVDPTGGGVDRHYHGLIWIPGARVSQDGHLLAVPVGTTPVRIGSVAGKVSGTDGTDGEELIIDEPPPGIDSTLRLGYEGVGNHRFGCLLQGTCPTAYPETPYPGGLSQGQCKTEATVTVTIYTGSTLPSSPARVLKPFDIVSSEVDQNGLLFSPHWFNVRESNEVTQLEVSDECQNFPYKDWLLVRRGIKSRCTQQSSFDVPKTLTECLLAPGFGELHGHVNWAPATFVGKLAFEEVSADKDVDLQLKTIGDRVFRFPGNNDFGKIAPILTKDSQDNSEYKGALWLEFATYETTNHFRPPWNKIKFPMRPNDLGSLKADFQDKTAIVSGLLNLDCVHDCHTELHPVFAMAVRAKSESEEGVSKSDSWAIFLRNQGNEGDCSLDQHYLNRDAYTFFLPAPPGAASGLPVVYNPDDAFSSNQKGLTWSIERVYRQGSNGILVRFLFTPNQDACNRIHDGEMTHISGGICLNWTGVAANLQTGCSGVYGSALDDESPSNTQAETSPVRFVPRQEQNQRCENANENLVDSQNKWSESHRRNGPNISFGTVTSQLRDLLGSDFGIFEELLLYNKTSQIQPNVGGRLAVIQTPLGSLEIDGAPSLSRNVRSTNGQSLSVSLSDWMAGLKVQFTRQLNMFAEAKVGQIFRSASSGYLNTPDFSNFHGHDTFFLLGGGIQPGNNFRAGGTRINLRVSVAYMRVTGTGENMVRITIGPQFQLHKKTQ